MKVKNLIAVAIAAVFIAGIATEAEAASKKDDKKKADSECLELLVRRGAEISDNEITFRKLHEKGVKIRL